MKRNQSQGNFSTKKQKEDLETEIFNSYAQKNPHQRHLINLITAVPDAKRTAFSETAYKNLVEFLENAPLEELDFNEMLTDRKCFGFTILSFLMNLSVKANDVRKIFTLLLDRVSNKLNFHLKSHNQSPLEKIIEQVFNQNVTKNDPQYVWLLKALIHNDVIGLNELNQELSDTGVTLFSTIVASYQEDLLELIVKKPFAAQLKVAKSGINIRTSQVADFIKVFHHAIENNESHALNEYFEQKRFVQKLLYVMDPSLSDEVMQKNLKELEKTIAEAPLEKLNLNHVIKENCNFRGVDLYNFQGATILQALCVIATEKNLVTAFILPFISKTPEKLDFLAEGEGKYEGKNCLTLISHLTKCNFYPLLKELIERDIIRAQELNFLIDPEVNKSFLSIFIDTLYGSLLNLIIGKPYLKELNFNTIVTNNIQNGPMSIFGALSSQPFFSKIVSTIICKVPFANIDFNERLRHNYTPLYFIAVNVAHDRGELLQYVLENIEPTQLNFKIIPANGISILLYIFQAAYIKPQIFETLLERFDIDQLDFDAKLNVPPNPNQTIREFMINSPLARKVCVIHFLECISQIIKLQKNLKSCHEEAQYNHIAQKLEQELMIVEKLAFGCDYTGYQKVFTKLIQVYIDCEQENALKTLAKNARLRPSERDSIYEYLANQAAFNLENNNKPIYESMTEQERKIAKREKKQQLLKGLKYANKIQGTPNDSKKLLTFQYVYGIDRSACGFPIQVQDPIFNDLDAPEKMFLNSIKGLRKQRKLKEKLHNTEDQLTQAQARIAELEAELEAKLTSKQDIQNNS